MKSSYDRLANICTNCSGHMAKMATAPILVGEPEIQKLEKSGRKVAEF